MTAFPAHVYILWYTFTSTQDIDIVVKGTQFQQFLRVPFSGMQRDSVGLYHNIRQKNQQPSTCQLQPLHGGFL
jgi:hypothetical protein